jgi:predicted GTPase
MNITESLNNENEEDAINVINRFVMDTAGLLINGNEEDLINNIDLLLIAATDVFNDENENDSISDANKFRRARQIERLQLRGITIALLGPSSSGKSTLAKVFVPGDFEEFGRIFPEYSTDNIRQYQNNRYSVLDCSGRNDQITYFEMKYIRLWKSVTRRLVLIIHTVKEMKNVLELFDELNLKCVLIVNKFDLLRSNERDRFKQQIYDEIYNYGFTCIDSVCFISAENPRQFQDDWMEMVSYLT